jgi:hypothetical protein
MIERLKESGATAFGFRVVGKLTNEDLKKVEPQLEFFIARHKKHPIGILADLTEMNGAEWMACWEDMRFLQRHTDHIARMAVVGTHGWDALAAMLTSGAANGSAFAVTYPAWRIELSLRMFTGVVMTLG